MRTVGEPPAPRPAPTRVADRRSAAHLDSPFLQLFPRAAISTHPATRAPSRLRLSAPTTAVPPAAIMPWLALLVRSFLSRQSCLSSLLFIRRLRLALAGVYSSAALSQPGSLTGVSNCVLESREKTRYIYPEDPRARRGFHVNFRHTRLSLSFVLFLRRGASGILVCCRVCSDGRARETD